MQLAKDANSASSDFEAFDESGSALVQALVCVSY
jgi:hypothetical protein